MCASSYGVILMNIGSVAVQTGLSAKTIRYYEELDLVNPVRSSNGYRQYSSNDIHHLQFLQRARSMSFTIDECRQLLSLYANEERASADVKALATEKIESIAQKITELEALRESLSGLVGQCCGDERSDCPIIDSLAGA